MNQFTTFWSFRIGVFTQSGPKAVIQIPKHFANLYPDNEI